ncbi:unnamed protein product [Linum trigynum]|uniref:Helitron helicase-like domain-containing protein n=1 Tax=Linum trigynum TaxID=586398 RepID=A0AAV2CPZ6_9ROSI
MFWYAERLDRHCNTTMPIFALCCAHGKVSLQLLCQTPPYLDSLLDVNGGAEAKHFRKEVRPYNGMFSMSSIGARLDRRVTNSSGPYSFVICGANYHHMGSLLPLEGQKPKFSQLYVFDTDDEVGDRLSNFSSTNLALRPRIVDGLIKMFDQTNELVKSFRRVAREVQDPANHNLRLRIAGSRENNNRQYDLPTGSDVVGLIPGDFNAEDGDRDIILNHRDEGLQRINSLNPKFHALQFPVLFPYGEDGFHLGIGYDPIHTSPSAKRKNVTEREFHAFRLQHRQSEGQSLMRGGKTLQHYCVDAFSTIEQNRLKFLRSNQKLLRAELYKGLCDAYSKGDTTGKGVGAILPETYTGGPRGQKSPKPLRRLSVPSLKINQT